jgi:scyllo-inositol 2-dehydrogenase (NADP+)
MSLRIALIGYGLAGSTFHAPVISAVPGLRVTAVVTGNPERQRQSRAEIPDARVLAHPDEVWSAAADFDSVVIATPNAAHLALGRAAITAGLPVVIDKPLAVSSAEAAELVELARVRDVLLSTYQNRRWDAEMLTLQRLLEDGELGRVHRFESRFERWRPRPKPGWRESGDPAVGGGTLLDLGTHLVDQATHLFGRVTNVYGEVSALRRDVAVDDDVFVALKHASGVTTHLWASALAAQRGPRLRVLGDGAAFVAPDLDPQEEALRNGRRPGDGGWGEVPEASWPSIWTGDDARRVRSAPGAWPRFYELWRDALLGQGPVPVDPEDAVTTLQILEAAALSAQSGQVISLAGAARSGGR